MKQCFYFYVVINHASLNCPVLFFSLWSMDDKDPSNEVMIGSYQQKPWKRVKPEADLMFDEKEENKAYVKQHAATWEYPLQQARREVGGHRKLCVGPCTETVFQDWVLPEALRLQQPLTSDLQNGTGRDSGELFLCAARGWQCARAQTKQGVEGDD